MNSDRRTARVHEQTRIEREAEENRLKSQRASKDSDYEIKFDLMELKDKVKNIAPRKRKALFELRRQLYAEQEGKCAECATDLEQAKIEQGFPFELDHIVPYSLGGGNERSNMQLLCRVCNNRKRAQFSNEELVQYYEDILNNL